MLKTARFLLALLVALVLMLCFRALAFTICTVEGEGLSPVFHRGDLVAFENPKDASQVLICRCKALPGDTIHQPDGNITIVPGRVNCANADHYWMEALSTENPTDSRLLGPIPEQFIIGRATAIVFSHDTTQPLWRGWDGARFLLAL